MLDQIGDRITGFLGIGGEDPTAAQQAQYQRAMEMLQSYRPRAMQARESGLAHSLSALGPANEYLKQMYGPEFGLDLQALSQPGVANYLTDPSSLQTSPPPPQQQGQGLLPGQGPIEGAGGSDLLTAGSLLATPWVAPFQLADEAVGWLKGLF